MHHPVSNPGHENAGQVMVEGLQVGWVLLKCPASLSLKFAWKKLNKSWIKLNFRCPYLGNTRTQVLLPGHLRNNLPLPLIHRPDLEIGVKLSRLVLFLWQLISRFFLTTNLKYLFEKKIGDALNDVIFVGVLFKWVPHKLKHTILV